MYLEQDFLTNIPLSFFDDSAVFDELSLRLPVSARTGNNTQLLYDALDRCVKIEERAGGSLTSTKQFIWCGTERCEERDASGNVVSQFFGLGQKTSGNSFYYNLDHLGSVREVTNSSGAIVTQVAFSPWGEATLLQGSTLPDFGYAGYYNHGRSGLNWTLYRAYSPGLGRWLSRDPLGESAGVNLYGYVGNNPVSLVDPLGLFVVVNYSTRTGVLSAVDSESGESLVVSSGIFSGDKIGGPPTPGEYFILPEDFAPSGTPVGQSLAPVFPLAQINQWQRLSTTYSDGRNGYEIHPGTISHGCVTFRHQPGAPVYPYNSDFNKLEDLLNRTRRIRFHGFAQKDIYVPGVIYITK